MIPTKKFATALLFACGLLMPSCSGDDMHFQGVYEAANGRCESDLMMPTVNIVWVCGSISSSLVERLLEITSSQNVVLVIDSMGGETLASIKLANYLRDNNVDLYVNKICLSACSQILAMSAHNIYFRQDSLFGMHDSQASTNFILGEVTDARLLYEEKAEEAFYAELGVNSDFLYAP
jgi:ATP-dependent protease ClpP protease subunit